jgi:HTH-type transcriptional regulator/antitoxin HigA
MNEIEYEAALKRLDEIWNAEPGSPDAPEFEALIVAVTDYKKEHWPHA